MEMHDNSNFPIQCSASDISFVRSVHNIWMNVRKCLINQGLVRYRV